jgi:hypothetical protein
MNVLAPSLVRTPMSARAQSNPAIVEFIEQKQPVTESDSSLNKKISCARHVISLDEISLSKVRYCAWMLVGHLRDSTRRHIAEEKCQKDCGTGTADHF